MIPTRPSRVNCSGALLQQPLRQPDAQDPSSGERYVLQDLAGQHGDEETPQGHADSARGHADDIEHRIGYGGEDEHRQRAVAGHPPLQESVEGALPDSRATSEAQRVAAKLAEGFPCAGHQAHKEERR